MAKDIYDKLKAIGELFKQYWLLGVMLFGVSFTGNIYQSMTKPAEPPKIDTAEKPKKITIKNPCGQCKKEIAEMNRYLQRQREYEKKLERALKEYHGE